MLKAQSLKSMRPRQWPKNLLMAAVIFDGRLTDFEALLRSITDYSCLISRQRYLINDVKDIQSDRQTVTKKFRPIASGKLSISAAE